MDIIYLMEKEGYRRRLSNHTIKAYCSNVKRFLGFCMKEPNKVTKKDIRAYMDYLASSGMSGNSMNVALSSLKFMAEEILFKTWKIRLKFSKRPKALPTVLTKKEVIALINAIDNKTHRLLVSLMYSAGLRLSELSNLKVENLEIDGGYGFIRKGKGNKDRVFVVAKNLKSALKELIKEKNDFTYLFEGRTNGHISKETIYWLIKQSAAKAGIKKNVHPHTLRHSFATHLIEDGYDLSSVQSLMGHNSPQTTKTYVHIASPQIINVKSPYDNLDLNK